MELATVFFGLTIWKHYLYGVHVNTFIDPKSFQYVFNEKDLNYCQTRWLELLKNYDMSVLYNYRKANLNVEALIISSMSSVGHASDDKNS